MHQMHGIAGLRISLASPEQIRAWSHGEVTRAETINYRTQKPERGGLFCERIFGPTTDWTCACGAYTREREQRGVCEKCGVELTRSVVRRERMGHIELAAPVAHRWFAQGVTNIMATLLNLSARQLESVIFSQHYLVLGIDETQRQHMLQQETIDQDLAQRLTTLSIGSVLARDDSLRLSAGAVRSGTGAEALREVLAGLDLDAVAAPLREQCHQGAVSSRRRAAKRLRVIEAFRRSGVRPEWMILTALPVLPPDLRPLVPLNGGRLATSDLNLLYERILHRNARIRRFQQHGAPEIMLNQEKRMLQKAVDALIDNARQSHPVTNARRQPLKSLTDVITGKSGRFRMNLLGKRVDYSGRSVIVGNPQLLLHQCGLPKKMACELFKPFLIHKLLDRHLASTARAARRMVERQHPAIWDQLAECLFERVVLLNRAPTLHRLSIQAFEPLLIEGSALQLHPQVCSAFNADFDGDQMAVHVPLSEMAQQEARNLLLSTRNLRSPASGEPSITISQEQVLGLFYLTQDRPNTGPVGKVFSSRDEARLAYDHRIIDLHTRISVRLDARTLFRTPDQRLALSAQARVETTVGRLLLNEALPEALQFRDYPMTKDRLKQLVSECLTRLGNAETARMADRLKTLGFAQATRAGISLSLADIRLPDHARQTIDTLVEEGKTQVALLSEQVNTGTISDQEWESQAIALWTERTEQVSRVCQESIDPYGTLATIMQSGATKARPQQIRQLNGIRGLMANPAGKIIPFPVLGNYLRGLLLWEVFIAASGARKGFGDRSLNTHVSGYLTRKLVEVGMPVWITQADCRTLDGIWITPEESQQRGFADLHPLLVGRLLAEDCGTWKRDTLVDEASAEQIVALHPGAIRLRSPLTCQAPVGLCQRCYGRDPATGQLVKPGTAVGVIAGQSIGEPGTQLTMRTFHSGGIAHAQGDITQGLPRVIELFEARHPKKKALLSTRAGFVKIEGSGTKRSIFVQTPVRFCTEMHLPEDATCLVHDREQVPLHHLLACWSDARTGPQELRARYPGQIRFGETQHCLQLWGEELQEQRYELPRGAHLAVTYGQAVEIGTPLTTGAIDPQELLAICGREATAHYLISEVQQVYRATGVFIAEQHLELIVRQMLRYVQISEEADTPFVPGDIVDRFVFAQANARILAEGGNPARARPILLGLVQAALHTSSWVAGASFQETTRVLTQAALRRQVDPLIGLKERLLLGLPMPTSTT